MRDEVGDGDDPGSEEPVESSQPSDADQVESPSMSVAIADMEAELIRHRFTVEEFIRMDEGGLFDPEARLELIDGEIFDVSPIRPPHAYAVDLLTTRFVQVVGDRAYIRSQNPAQCDKYSLPQPDVILAELPADRYRTRHPRWPEILLAVEVSDSTVRRDRRLKILLYARSGIPEAWLVNIPRRQVEVYTEPTEGRYRLVVRRLPGEVLSPVAFPDVEIAVSDLLPPQELVEDE